MPQSPSSTTEQVTVRSVDTSNWREVFKLTVTQQQQAFVAVPGYYLALCCFGGTWKPFAIYLDEQIIGLIMWARDNDQSCWLGGIFIDQSYQGQGYGRQAIEAMMAMLSEQYSCQQFALSYHPSNLVAKHLYSSMSFVETGEMEDDEVVARLL